MFAIFKQPNFSTKSKQFSGLFWWNKKTSWKPKNHRVSGKLIQNIDKILSKEALEQLGISLPESEEIRSSVLEAVKANEEDKKEIAKKIVDITKNIKK